MFSKENVYFYIHILKSNKSDSSTRRALASVLTRREGVSVSVCTPQLPCSPENPFPMVLPADGERVLSLLLAHGFYLSKPGEKPDNMVEYQLYSPLLNRRFCESAFLRY